MKVCEIGGKLVQLRYTVNSLCAVEQRAGGSLDALMERQFSATRLLLWGAMLPLQPETTLEAAGELIGAHIIGGGTLEEVVNFCAEALTEAGFFAPAAL